jgi:hypothetical protein
VPTRRPISSEACRSPPKGMRLYRRELWGWKVNTLRVRLNSGSGLADAPVSNTSESLAVREKENFLGLEAKPSYQNIANLRA